MLKHLLKVARLAPVLLLCISVTAFAQRTVTGKVTSKDDGSGVPGVNVVEKGTTNGAATDIDGKFSISVGNNATLIFSAIGFSTQEVAVGAQSVVDVALSSDVTTLSEVVVTGYGSQEKKEITGSAVALDTKDFNRGTINDPSQLLQGKVAGLSIYNKGGDPNSSSVIRLRGLSTVGANTQPLIVVDGVIGATLDNIDPNDIASISVLKDGSAAAIYGSRGSSGVILVTTKRGSRAGGLNVSFNSSVAAASVYRNVPVMDASQYVAAGGNDLGSKTDWQKEVTQTGISKINNLAISAGAKNTTFRMSTNWRDVSGVLKKSGFNQINTRANLTHHALNDKLTIDLNMAFTHRDQDFSFNEALRYAVLYNPTAPVRFPSGDYYQAILFDNFNPVAILDQNVNIGKTQNLNYSAKIDYAFTKALTFSANYAQQFNTGLRNEYYASKSLFRGLNRNGLARKSANDGNFTLFEAYGSYAKSSDKINLNATAGYSYQEQQDQGMFVELGNFPSDALGYSALQLAGDRISGLASNVNISSFQTPVNKIIAGFARVSLTFNDAIFFNASVRREGSTKLGPDNRWGTFPAVGLGVDLNKYLNLPSFSLLKFRVGYGVTGSLPGQSGLAQDQYDYSFNGGGNVVLAVNGNKDLKWEQKAETNIGIEFGTGKISGGLDIYQRKITDAILFNRVDVAVYPSGYQWQNAASLSTKGLELTLNHSGVNIGAVSWAPGIVLSTYKTVLDKFNVDRSVRADFGAPGQNGTYPILVQVGQPIGQIWGPVFDGVNDNGSPKFKDLNGDGVVESNPSEALSETADFKTLGYGIPSLELGWSNRFTYKNWDLNVFFRGAFGHSLVNQFRGFYEPLDPGAINSYNRIITDKAVAGLTSAQYSSLYVEKADFLKLDNLTLGYNFKLNSSSAIKSLRVYFSGQNLFLITKYTGIDPEPQLQDYGNSDNGGFVGGADVLAPGIDRRNNYFFSRTLTFGLNLGF